MPQIQALHLDMCADGLSQTGLMLFACAEASCSPCVIVSVLPLLLFDPCSWCCCCCRMMIRMLILRPPSLNSTSVCAMRGQWMQKRTQHTCTCACIAHIQWQQQQQNKQQRRAWCAIVLLCLARHSCVAVSQVLGSTGQPGGSLLSCIIPAPRPHCHVMSSPAMPPVLVCCPAVQ